jgi:hypothetical protein
MTEFDWSGWTDWSPLAGLALDAVPEGPGAYVIATDQPINRAVGTDPAGFLDVGESGALRNRLWGFRQCVTVRGEEWHSAGWRFAFFRFDRHFPVASLRVRWIPTASKEEAYKVEGRVLLAYLMRHGELPPLNYKFNWKPFEELGWKVFDDVAADAELQVRQAEGMTVTEAPITRERIDELLRFLPTLGTPGPDTEPNWKGLDQEPEGGVFVMPYPTYPPAVEEFFKLAAQPCWRDYKYEPSAAGDLVRSDAAIASASLAQIKTVLTFCVQGEKFCDGHWGAMVREGRIAAVLRRLQELRDTVA